MISCYLQGGLGNYLFQISTSYAKSLELNTEFILNDNDCYSPHKKINHYYNNFFRKIKFDSNLLIDNFFNEKEFRYSKLPDFEKDTKLIGYFQSEKYFINKRKEILELFECPDNVNNKIFNRYPELLNNKTCSIHVRRGDYINLKDFHTVQKIDYYLKSVEIIGNDFTFLIFSDDINWCKQNFNFLNNKIYCENNEDFEDLYIMSYCNNNIIANSSFSWWGGWLNKNPNKVVIYPEDWFGPANSHLNITDLTPNEWIKI